MADAKNTKRDTINKLNGVVGALNLYPQTTPNGVGLSDNISLNPFSFLLDIIKTSGGYDIIIELVSKFIATWLPAIEWSTKTILMTNIQSMLSCSIKPIINEDMIKNGVVFDLELIDLFRIFNYCPLSESIVKNGHIVKNPGRYFYFDCSPENGFETTDDLEVSRDFNVLLWYMKNISGGNRKVWRRERDIGKPYNIKKRTSRNGKREWTKQVKSNGIVTLEYCARPDGLKNAEGNAYSIKEPINNCIHVFIGNCCGLENSFIDDNIKQCRKLIVKYDNFITTLDEYKDLITQEYNNRKAQLSTNSSDEIFKLHDRYLNELRTIRELKKCLNGNDTQTCSQMLNGQNRFEFELLPHNKRLLVIPQDLFNSSLTIQKNNIIQYESQKYAISSQVEYPSIESNYYYRRTMFEWNYDFVWSMKLFDEKVVAAQLLEAITKCLSSACNFNLSIERNLVNVELRELVKSVITNDDGNVSDCFFAFSNDKYNTMLQETEMERLGLLTNTNGDDFSRTVSAEEILEQLNTLSDNATKEEVNSAIQGSIFSAVSSVYPHDVGEDATKGKLNYNSNANMLEELLTNLTYAIVMVILSPKIYILLTANLKMLGNEPSFDLQKFLKQYRNMIVEIIKGVRDEILDYFEKEALKIIQTIVKKYALMLSVEQFENYRKLLQQCVKCFKLHSKEYDWQMDDVSYADITETIELLNEEC